MLVVGLTGGIGSGKTTVGHLLAERGAVIVDADQIAREVVEPGHLAYQGVVERFGPSVVLDSGVIDRGALAAVVFDDAEARADLNGIVHPAVGEEMAKRLAAHAGTDAVVVLDIPLLAEGGRDRYPLAGVVVVDTPVETAVERLVHQRGMTEADARARIAAQATREERRAIADVVIDNGGDRPHLEAEVARAWDWVQAKRAELV